MTKLTETQSALLASAASRLNNRVLPTPTSLKKNKGSIALLLKGFLKKGLIAEVAAEADDELWREDKQEGRMTLIITPTGFKAIGVELPKKKPKKSEAKTEKLLKTVKPKAASKIDLLVNLLKRKQGMTLQEAMEATGWQKHSIRGSMSGMIKKKLGRSILSEETKRGRVYRIENGSI